MFLGGEAGSLDLEAADAVKALPDRIDSPLEMEGTGMYSDVNGNGRIDFADVVWLFNAI